MKSILIIGLGRFGTHLCQDLAKLDNEIMIVDKDEASLEDLLPLVVSAKYGSQIYEIYGINGLLRRK